jgi:hypothetical protein
MNTREIAAEYRLTHWAGIMRDRAESGLSIKAYCENAGFHENVYYYWQRKLREAACGQMDTPGFAEVRLSKAERQLALPGTSQVGRLHIETCGIHITADSTYPPEKLTALLRGLSRA